MYSTSEREVRTSKVSSSPVKETVQGCVCLPHLASGGLHSSRGSDGTVLETEILSRLWKNLIREGE
jgi:hypothetical protein